MSGFAVDKEPIFRKVALVNQAAKIHRFCSVKDGPFWTVTAEVEQIVKPSKIGDYVVPTAFSIVDGTVNARQPASEAIDHLVKQNFPVDLWKEITSKDFESLTREFATD